MSERLCLSYEFLVSALIKEQDPKLPRILSSACERAMRAVHGELEGSELSVPRQFLGWQKEGSNLPPVALIVRVNSANMKTRQGIARLVRRHLNAESAFAPYCGDRIVMVTSEDGQATYQKA